VLKEVHDGKVYRRRGAIEGGRGAGGSRGGRGGGGVVIKVDCNLFSVYV